MRQLVTFVKERGTNVCISEKCEEMDVEMILHVSTACLNASKATGENT